MEGNAITAGVRSREITLEPFLGRAPCPNMSDTGSYRCHRGATHVVRSSSGWCLTCPGHLQGTIARMRTISE